MYDKLMETYPGFEEKLQKNFEEMKEKHEAEWKIDDADAQINLKKYVFIDEEDIIPSQIEVIIFFIYLIGSFYALNGVNF